MKLLSIIVPCYNEEAALSFFLPAVRKAAAGLRDKHQLACEVLSGRNEIGRGVFTKGPEPLRQGFHI